MHDRRGAWAVLAGLGIAMAAMPFAPLQLDHHHDGYMFKAALDVARGDVLYRDTLMQYCPIPTWINAVGVKVLGEHVLSIRVAAVVAYGVAGSLFFLVWRRLMPTAWALLAIVLWFAYADFFRDDRPLYPWASVYLLVFHALVMYCAARGVEAKDQSSRWWHAAAGAAAAAALLCRLTSGAAFFVGLLVLAAIDRDRRRRVRPTITGFVSVLVAFVGWALVTRAADDVWEQMIVWPYRWSDAVSGSGLIPIFFAQARHGVLLGCAVAVVVRLLAIRAAPMAASFINGLTGLAIGGVIVWRWDTTWQLWDSSALIALVGLLALGRSVRTRTVTPFVAAAVLAAAGLVQLFPAPDITHLWWSAAAGVGVLLAGGLRIAPHLRLHSPFALAVGISVVVAVPLVSQAVSKVDGEWVELGDASEITDGMYANPETAESTRKLLRAFDRIDDNRPVLHVGRNALWGSFTDARDFSPQKVDWGPGRAFGPLELRYVREERPVVVTTGDHADLFGLLDNELNYIRLVHVVVEEWGRHDYLVFVPREEKLEPEPSGLWLPMPQSPG